MSRDRGRRPPRLARLLLCLCRLGGRRPEIETDLAEAFAIRAAESGPLRARLRFWLDVVSLFRYRQLHVLRDRVDRRPSLDSLGQDLRYAARVFRCHIGVVAVTVVGLALAIGVSATIVGTLESIVLRPFGGPASASVVAVRALYRGGVSGGAWWTRSEFDELRDAVGSVRLEAYSRTRAPLGDEGSAGIPVLLVSGGFFETFGFAPVVGRLLGDADQEAVATPPVVLSHDFWRTRFGGDVGVIGRSLRLMGREFEVVGVAPPGLTGPEALPPAAFAPYGFSVHDPLWHRDLTLGPIVQLVGRLRPGATLERAQAEITAIAAAMPRSWGASEGEPRAPIVLHPVDDRLSDAGAGPLPRFLTVVGVVLSMVALLACTNLANTLLALALSRRREIGLRLALGASRRRIARQLLTESLALSIVGGGLGLTLAAMALPVMERLFASAGASVPLSPGPGFQWAAAGLSLAVGVVAGLAPMYHGARGDLAGPIEGRPVLAGGLGRPGRLQTTLIGTQATVSILLLVLAALLSRSLMHVGRIEPGLEIDRLVEVEARVRAAGYDEAGAIEYWDRVKRRLTALPGVEGVGVTLSAPVRNVGATRGYVAGGRRRRAHLAEVSASYLAAAGIAMRAGRPFSEEEVTREAPVAVISESLARHLWPSGDALGAFLDPLGEAMSGVRVVGIAADTVTSPLEIGIAKIYLPLPRERWGYATLIARSAGDPGAALPALLDAVRSLDPEVFVTAAPVRDYVASSRILPRLLAVMSGALATIALGLAATGIFGLTVFSVEQRTAELGVRLALGARGRDVAVLVVGEALRPVLWGTASGLALALASSRVLAAVLYGVSAHDPLSATGAAAVMISAAALAAIWPTMRATRVDPMSVLGTD